MNAAFANAACELYPQINTIYTDNDGQLFAKDAEDNFVEIDEALVNERVPVKQTELAWENLRLKRDRRLAETDWWASSDRTMTAEQTAYRQALRDLPANTTDPENPVWPTKP